MTTKAWAFALFQLQEYWPSTAFTDKSQDIFYQHKVILHELSNMTLGTTFLTDPNEKMDYIVE